MTSQQRALSLSHLLLASAILGLLFVALAISADEEVILPVGDSASTTPHLVVNDANQEQQQQQQPTFLPGFDLNAFTLDTARRVLQWRHRFTDWLRHNAMLTRNEYGEEGGPLNAFVNRLPQIWRATVDASANGRAEDTHHNPPILIDIGFADS